MLNTGADARGSEVSPGSLLQDQLVEGEVGDRFAQALVLGLQLLHALDLVRLAAAILLTPAVIRDLGHPDGADRLHHRGALRNQNIHLAQLGDNLFRLVSLRRHRSPPSARMSHTSGWTTPRGADHVPLFPAMVTPGWVMGAEGGFL